MNSKELQALKSKLKRTATKKRISANKLEQFLAFADYYIAHLPYSLRQRLESKSDDLYDEVHSLFAHMMATPAERLNLNVHKSNKNRRIFIDLCCPNIAFTVGSLLNELAVKDLYIHSQHNFMVQVSYTGTKKNKRIAEIKDEYHLDETLSLKAGSKEYKKADTANTKIEDSTAELVVIRLITEFMNPDEIAEVIRDITSLYEELHRVNADWQAMDKKLAGAINDYELSGSMRSEEDKSKLELLKWIRDDKCVLLGHSQVSLPSSINKKRGTDLKSVQSSKNTLGLFSTSLDKRSPNKINKINQITAAIKPQEGINFFKLPVVSRIYRRVYIQYISISYKKGKQLVEERFLVLYSFNFYSAPLESIPYLGTYAKIQMRRLNIIENTYRWRMLRYSLTIYPRDEFLHLIGTPTLDLIVDRIMEAFYSNNFRSLVYYDKSNFFINLAIFVPREDYSTDARLRFESLFRDKFKTSGGDFNVIFSEERLARVFINQTLTAESPLDVDLKTLENEIRAIGTGWNYKLRQALLDSYGTDEGIRLYREYSSIFRASYYENFSSEKAAQDLEDIIKIGRGDEKVKVSLYYREAAGESAGRYVLRIIAYTKALALSKMVQVLENAGAEPKASRPYFFSPTAAIKQEVRILEIDLDIQEGNLAQGFQEPFCDLITLTLLGIAEDNEFNSLALSAAMDAKQISLLRAWAKYLSQVQSNFSFPYIRNAVCAHPHCATILLQLFHLRFGNSLQNNKSLNSKPSNNKDAPYKKLTASFDELLDKIPSIEQDQILRHLREIIDVTTRTNFYKCNLGEPLSFKLNPNHLSFCDEPQPQFEIFVYSADFEGLHLRDGPLARGGIRWSDKRVGYRQEIYQLVKAQIVKNAIIVPTGAKGGFFIKNEEKSGREIYAEFIGALLELTDNLIDGKIVRDKQIIAYDEQDPYLVVAPDKGTADFSDLANLISAENNFWLDDAFASSGSNGYSHKDMGITARGAWESVRRSFAEIGIDPNQEQIEVIGVGDMSGDVFGNGVLLSKSIKLIAAFNHRNIFIDPEPDPAKSYKERMRLFKLAKSTWQDYNAKLISPGGGVFSRTAKSIKLSQSIRNKFAIKETSLEPNQLIRYILKASADLLWFGGIGTYIKGADESNLEVEDRPNDAIRIDAKEARVKVIGEGANLGLSLKGRIEFDINGGKVATDSNDNSGGVHCSDREVNIKILLSLLHRKGKISAAQKKSLLHKVQDQVGEDVIRQNEAQSLSLSLERYRAVAMFGVHSDLAEYLSLADALDMADEMQYFTRAQISLILGAMKQQLRKILEPHKMIDKDYLLKVLLDYFPKDLSNYFAELPNKQARELISQHYVANEILNTQIANIMVDKLSLGFWEALDIKEMIKETPTENKDSKLPKFVEAFFVLDEMFNYSSLMHNLAASLKDYPNTIETILELQSDFAKIINYAVACDVSFFTDDQGMHKSAVYKHREQFMHLFSNAETISSQSATEIDMLKNGIDIIMGIELKHANKGMKISSIIRMMRKLDEILSIDKILDRLNKMPDDNIWTRRAVRALSADIVHQKRRILSLLCQDLYSVQSKNHISKDALKKASRDTGNKRSDAMESDNLASQMTDQIIENWQDKHRASLTLYRECAKDTSSLNTGGIEIISYLLSLLRSLS